MDYGGYAAEQARLRTNPSWGRALLLEEDIGSKHPLVRSFRVKCIAGQCVIEGSWQQRIQRADHPRAPPLTLEQFPLDIKVESRSRTPPPPDPEEAWEWQMSVLGRDPTGEPRTPGGPPAPSEPASSSSRRVSPPTGVATGWHGFSGAPRGSLFAAPG